jgi:hypothetical protein
VASWEIYPNFDVFQSAEIIELKGMFQLAMFDYRRVAKFIDLSLVYGRLMAVDGFLLWP